jgi:hypothetical protein
MQIGARGGVGRQRGSGYPRIDPRIDPWHRPSNGIQALFGGIGIRTLNAYLAHIVAKQNRASTSFGRTISLLCLSNRSCGQQRK